MHVNARALIERTTAGGTELLLQWRNKPYEGSPKLELPGGRVEEFESLVEAVRREVREETGLELVEIDGVETRIETEGPDFRIESLHPFAVYQTLHGPVDSMGVYFRCRAQGELLSSGDETEHPRWMSVAEIKRLIAENPGQFSWVDRAGLAFYLNHQFQKGE